ncbi:MAG TPA: hypothetical protein PLX59_05895 [Candidatus Cloacimonadota bacterium]|nr:hypothetical protein [Candidatus Cloacimonadota bacterium]
MTDDNRPVVSKKLFRIIVFALSLLIVLLLILPSFRKQVDLEQMIQDRYGITFISPQWHGLDYDIELIQVDEIQAGSFSERVGFMKGDLIFGPRSDDLTAFLTYLNQDTGTDMTVYVVREAEFKPGKNFQDSNRTLDLRFSAP